MPPSSRAGWSLPEPMRAVPVNDPALPPGHAAQVKWDGYRALAGRWADGRVVVRSRNGTDLARAFPEIEEPVRRLPDDSAVNCELVVWEAGRFAFERLQQRMHLRGTAAARTAEPAKPSTAPLSAFERGAAAPGAVQGPDGLSGTCQPRFRSTPTGAVVPQHLPPSTG